MGLYDRDYAYQPQQPGFHVSSPQTLTTQLVLITAGVYVLQLLIEGFTAAFCLTSNWYLQPWQCYRLLTYGFLHDPHSIQHIFWNMFGLWMFGRDVEYRIGRREYLTFYLTAVILAGVVWTASESVLARPAIVVGASGAITAVLILFALNFPHRTVLFMFFIPMPMWVLACIIVGVDLMGAVQQYGNVAFTAHLGGAAYALAYHRFRWSPGRWVADKMASFSLRPKPKLRIHAPKNDDAEIDERVDQILQKIQEHGQDSLTWRERRILEKASKEYQRKRH